MHTTEAIQQRFSFAGRTRNLPWYPRRGTRDDLAALFGTLGFTRGVEVGTQRGLFSEVLCKANPALRLICVDPWMAYNQVSERTQEAHFAEATARLAPYGVAIRRACSLDAVGTIRDGSLDFVYIDGNHLFDHAIRDLIAWVPKVRPDGIVAVHDYHSEVGADVITAVNAYTHCHDIRPWYVTREHLPTAFWVHGGGPA